MKNINDSYIIKKLYFENKFTLSEISKMLNLPLNKVYLMYEKEKNKNKNTSTKTKT